MSWRVIFIFVALRHGEELMDQTMISKIRFDGIMITMIKHHFEELLNIYLTIDTYNMIVKP